MLEEIQSLFSILDKIRLDLDAFMFPKTELTCLYAGCCDRSFSPQ